MTDHTLRTAGPPDAPAIDALTQAAYAKWVPVIGRKPRPMTVDYARAVLEHRIDIVEVDGELAALIELEALPDHLMIVNLAVAPEHQGGGLGRALLGHAEALAQEMGLAELRLYTNSLMAANIALYRRHGYLLSHEEQVGAGRTIVHMRKPLSSLDP
ncbi:MAG TPA: GNAT family N-acetyltransferase [Devosiaceae bacterium]|jgi:ribosomal protein S18 acetylase RimI-like enzyme|nr:GNAT family N-acetyltransferase [Devosiaceae bacterium]